MIRMWYHQWRMNAEYNTIFGDPRPTGNGLASYDVTDINVDDVLARYDYHRTQLVELQVLAHLVARFPYLASDGTVPQATARSEFVHRIWDHFPGHKHFYLAGDGSFETWVPIATREEWNTFLESEMTVTADRTTNKAVNPSGGSDRS